MLLPAVPPFSTNFRIFEHVLTRLGRTSNSVDYFSIIIYTVFLVLASQVCPRWDLWVHKTWNFDYIQALQSELAQHKWSSWMSNRKLLSYFFSAKSALCSSSLLFLEIWPILCCWSIFRIFEHSKDKSEICWKNHYGNITIISSLI